MYNSYFGFREKPFKLVPNPDYLFLSKSHEVSLAHLSYATDQGDGFVVITGEVGTGKTTLCRIFLERLDNETECAYIFNPKLDSVQLLATICNEFGIETTQPTVKGLLDVLNRYLITKNKEGRNVILLIDEAQNLTIENLELIRMLSNLETTRSKLLQIILVGQPELSDKLDSYELRQLSQRISLRCHLTPLSGKETEGYIRHRINIAAQRSLELFSAGACRKIHQSTAGIPRLINITCDRALLSAYSLNRKKVTAAVAATAIKELGKRGPVPDSAPGRRYLAWGAAACLICFSIGIWVVKSEILKPKPEGTAQPAAQDEPAEISSLSRQVYKIETSPSDPSTPYNQTPADGRVVPPEPDTPADTPEVSNGRDSFDRTIEQLDAAQSRLDAVAALLTLWKQPKPHANQFPTYFEDAKYFDIAARQYGLRAHRMKANWSLIQRINLPCILTLRQNNQTQPVYMTLEQWKDARVVLSAGVDENKIEVELDQVKPYLSGDVFLFWKNVTGFDFIIGSGADSGAINTLKSLLQSVGYGPFDKRPVFDGKTRRAVIKFQARSKIIADGLVGPLTKIMLINAAKACNVPQLKPLEETGA